MANDRHTMFFMGKEYPNVAMGGGSGGGSFNVTDLFVNEQHSDLTQITLSESIENYDLIEFIVEDRTYLNYTSFVYDSEWMVNNVPYVSDNPTGTFPQLFMLGYDNHYMRATMGQTNDKLIIPTDKNTLMIYAVRGIKCGSGGGGGGSDVEPNPSGEPTDTLTTIGIDGTIYDIAGGGEPTKTLVYQLGAGGRWETFSNPHSSKKLLVEAEGYGIVRGGEFEPTLLPAREGGDNYVTIANTPVGNLAINLGQTGSGETIYISTNGGYDTNIQTVRVYKLD